MYILNTIEELNSLKLKDNGYNLWMWQHHAKSPEGFFAWFWAISKTEMEIVTFSEEVENAILEYR